MSQCSRRLVRRPVALPVSPEAHSSSIAAILATPRRIVIRGQRSKRPELKAGGDTLCRIEIEPRGTAAKLPFRHTIEREPSRWIDAVSGSWPKIISNLKSLMETGSTVLADAYPTGNQR
jgi:hypothetical protein